MAFALVALVLLLPPLVTTPAFARAAGASAGQRAASPQGHATILVLDMSGSMGQPGQSGNDPNGLRCSAAHAYIDLSGPGQWVGIVGLSHPVEAPGSPFSAQDYAQPAEMSTNTARAAMRRALDTQSNNCIGDGTTPMADALARAEHMLLVATQGGSLSGSVILLTDGLPDPNANSQIAAIHGQLPTFESHNWPIDTIALGDADRGFLRGLADATGGTAYDVAHGPVPGISPLNLEPFFIDIFRINAGRTLLHAVPPLTITGPTQRQFHVGRFIAHMDVLVVRDSANVGVQLYAPGNYPNAPVQPGQARIVDNDPHYAIFSVDAPIRGDWVLAFTGAGQLLTDALLQSTLALQLVSPHANQHLPVGLPLPVNAALRDGQDQVLAEPVTLTATLTPANGAGQTGREVPLVDPGGSSPTGNFQGHVTIPLSAPRGTYEVTLQAQLNDALISLVVPVVFEAFPVPTLLSPSDGKPQPSGLSLAVVPGVPLAVSFGLTVNGALQAEPNVTATLMAGGQAVSLSPFAGTWQGTYVPSAAGAQPLVVHLGGTYHGTDLTPWSYTLPLSLSLRPSLSVTGLDARRPYPAHRSVTVVVAYFRQAGVPDPSAVGHITAVLLPPDGVGIPLALQPRLNASGQPDIGSYTATLAFGDPGTYTLHAIFDDGVSTDHSEQLFVLRVIDFPTATTAPRAPGERLTDWGVLGGLYGAPVVSWLAGPPLSGTPSQPTATLQGQVTLSGQAYTGGTVRAVAYAVGSDRPIPATVTRDGAAYTVSFHPSSPGAYQIVTTWRGDFAGLRADQEPTTDVLQLAIVGPDLGGWARAWTITLVYLVLLALLAQLGRYGATPAPAGALQAAERPDDLYYLDQRRTPLWRRFLWRNRVSTTELGLPPGAELRFRRYRGPLVVAEPGAGAEVLVGNTALQPGASPVELEGAGLTFRQGTLGLDDELDDGERTGGADRTAGSARRRSVRARDHERETTVASHYVYLTQAELRERHERDDPFAGLTAAAEASDDPFAEEASRPTTLLGHIGGLLASLRPLPRVSEDDEATDLWLGSEESPPRRGRRRAAVYDDADERDGHLGSRAGRRTERPSGRARHDDLYAEDAAARRRSRRSGRAGDLDDLDDLAVRPRRRSADDEL